MTDMIQAICSKCGNKYGSMPEGHVCGWWQATCDICGEETGCTAPRDYRYLPNAPKKIKDRL